MQIVTPTLLSEAQREMQVRVRILAACNVRNFILSHGGTPPKDLDDRLDFLVFPTLNVPAIPVLP